MTKISNNPPKSKELLAIQCVAYAADKEGDLADLVSIGRIAGLEYGPFRKCAWYTGLMSG